jgi:hypothetical protein
VGLSRRHTSEPRWERRRPAVDLGAGRVVVASADDPASRESAAAWRTEAEDAGIGTQAVLPGPDGDVLPGLARALADAPAATRVLLAGDEAFLGAAYAVALGAGLRPAEIRAHQTVERARRVRCTHCRAITETDVPVGGRTTCGGCGVPLEVFHHYSRRLGAYMGFHADAEELAA